MKELVKQLVRFVNIVDELAKSVRDLQKRVKQLEFDMNDRNGKVAKVERSSYTAGMWDDRA